jgi:hypothetical protein
LRIKASIACGNGEIVILNATENLAAPMAQDPSLVQDDHRAQFKKMQAAKIEIDLSEMPRPGRA